MTKPLISPNTKPMRSRGGEYRETHPYKNCKRNRSMFKSTFKIKHSFLLLLFMGISLQTLNGQVLISLLLGDKLNSDKLGFGLDGGVNFSNITNLEKSKWKTAFNLGFYFDIKIKEKLFIHTGVQVKSTLGAKGLDPYPVFDPELDWLLTTAEKVKRKIHYFNVPVLLRYTLPKHLFMEFGPQIGLRYKAYDEFTASITSKNDFKYKNDIRDQIKHLDAGLMAGFGYHLTKGRGMNFGIRYYQGFVNISKDDNSKNYWNSSVYLFASIPIGAGNANSKKTKQNESSGE
jgi:hypothetical protein